MADRRRQDKKEENKKGNKSSRGRGSGKRQSIKTTDIGSTTSLGKRRTRLANQQRQQQLDDEEGRSRSPSGSRMSNSEYGSQASPMRRLPAKSSSDETPVKVAILGAAGGIGQPLSLLLMLHSEYIQHLALYDVVHVRGVGADLSHVDRQCRVTAHLGPDELADAVRGAKVIVIPAGLAQKPGMSRDDLFGSNAKIMFNLARVCATVAPQAQLAIISNPVNSLVPLTCEVYYRTLTQQQQQQVSSPLQQDQQQQQQQANKPEPQQDNAAEPEARKSEGKQQQQHHATPFHDSFRRIFGVTTLDVVRASTLLARSPLYKPQPNGLFRDPSKLQVPVVGGHAGKTIIPLLSQATPKLERRSLLSEDKSGAGKQANKTVQQLVESIQQAGIEVLNAKQGAGSATLAMAYAACRFTISLLRAASGEQNVVECAYVRQRDPIQGVPSADHHLDYFSTPMLLGRDGYVKSLGLVASPAAAASSSSDGSSSSPAKQQQDQLLPFELQMIEEGARELRLSVAKGEDFAKERLSAEK